MVCEVRAPGGTSSYPPTHPPIHLPIRFRAIHSFIHSSIHPPTHPPTHPPAHPIDYSLGKIRDMAAEPFIVFPVAERERALDQLR